MTAIKDNSDIIKLLPHQEAKFNLLMERVRIMKAAGGNGETKGSEKQIIAGLMAERAYFQKLQEIETQLMQKIYHKTRWEKFVWRMKRRLKVWKQRLQR